jgi:hypothetical protein
MLLNSTLQLFEPACLVYLLLDVWPLAKLVDLFPKDIALLMPRIGRGRACYMPKAPPNASSLRDGSRMFANLPTATVVSQSGKNALYHTVFHKHWWS